MRIRAVRRESHMWRDTSRGELGRIDRDERTVSVFLLDDERAGLLRASSCSIATQLLFGYDPRARMYKDGRGKPQVSGANLHMSISHSGTCLVVAIGTIDLGVDMEYMRYPTKWESIYRWINDPQDRMALPNERDFLECWTAKEALLKLLGTGLDFGLHRVSVPAVRSSAWRNVAVGDGRIWLKPLPRWNDMVLCLALKRLDVVRTYHVVDVNDMLRA
jgi:phosphopantetheinyl transferase